MTLTKSQKETWEWQHSKLLKKLENFSPKRDAEEQFKDVCLCILRDNCTMDDADPDELIAEIKISLHTLGDFLSAESFAMSSYHVLLLKSTAEWYGVFSVPEDILSILSRDVLTDSVLMIHVWFAVCFGVPKEELSSLID